MPNNNLIFEQKSEFAWQPGVINPDSWYRSDNIVLSASSVHSLNYKGTNGANAIFGAGEYGVLLTGLAAINSKNAIEYDGNASSDVTFGTTQLFNNSQSCCFVGLVSGASWSGSYYSFLQLNNGSSASSYGIYMTALDPSAFPTYASLQISTGDNSTKPIGINGFGSAYYGQYFWYLINYNGGGLGNTANWQIYINGVSQTLFNPSSASSGGTNLTNALLLTQPISPSSAIVEFFSKQGMMITGSNLTGLTNYMQSRYGL